MSIETSRHLSSEQTASAYSEALNRTETRTRMLGAYSVAETSVEPTVSLEQRREQQAINEKEYFDDIIIHPAEYDTHLMPTEIVDRMEVDHVVKRAPLLKDQVSDLSRHNTISSRSRNGAPGSATEHDALVELQQYLEVAGGSELVTDNNAMIAFEAHDILEKLTFIGEKEYSEAAYAIAGYWKSLLAKNPQQQIYAATGYIMNDPMGMLDKGEIKSDKYLLEHVLENFSDEELSEYSSQIVTRPEDITAVSAKDLKVVFLDDWTISGTQLSQAAESFIEEFPQFTQAVEVQLIVADERRIKRGLIGPDFGSSRHSYHSKRESLPIRAYYLAPESPMTVYDEDDTDESGARITGSHSTVDYGFQDNLRSMQRITELIDRDELSETQKGEYDRLSTTPILAEVARPYRQPNYRLIQEQRLDRIRALSQRSAL